MFGYNFHFRNFYNHIDSKNDRIWHISTLDKNTVYVRWTILRSAQIIGDDKAKGKASSQGWQWTKQNNKVITQDKNNARGTNKSNPLWDADATGIDVDAIKRATYNVPAVALKIR